MRALLRQIVAARAEGLVAVALLGGWALLTWAAAVIAAAFTARAWVAWPLSGGLLLLSLVGWRLILVLFGEGLYALTHRSAGGRRG